MTGSCKIRDPEESCVFLRVNGDWIRYEGSTSDRKLYYRAYQAKKWGSSKFYVYEFGQDEVTGIMMPNDFHNNLSCVSMDGIPSYALPHRILLNKKLCKFLKLTCGHGSVCTHCGKYEPSD